MIKFCMIVLFFLVSLNLYPQVSPGNPDAIPVEFRFTHQLAATDSGVGVNGSMNSWTNGVFRMRQTNPGLYKVSLDLLPLTYEYKFVTFVDTVGQAGVTGYYTDPLNPRLGGPFNNSYITVNSPMIFYLLPKNGATITNSRPEITANISWAYKHQIDPASFIFKIDNAEVPNAGNYFDPGNRFFSYQPASPFSLGAHSVYLKCSLTNGDTVSLASSFTVIENTSSKPFTFTFDSGSPNFNFLSPITRVDIKGSFNQNGQNLMTDPDGDGIYTYGTNLIINEPNEYTIIVNTGLYMNDPDNPVMSANHRTVAVRKKYSVPYFLDFSPAPGVWYTYPDSTSITINCKVLNGDTTISVNNSSVKAILNGTTQLPVTTTGFSDGYNVRVTVPVTGPGRYAVDFQAKDIYGNPAKSVNYHFGVRNAVPGPGYVYYDGENDDKGSGNFVLPVPADTGAADIRSIKLNSSQNGDSLTVDVEMERITASTRFMLMINHDISSQSVEVPQNVKLRVPDWQNKGAYIILAAPNSAYLDTASENRIILSRAPETKSDKLQVTLTGGRNNIFRFTVPLSALLPVLGTYNNEWYYLGWSYLKGSSGTIKVGPQLGGYDYAEATNAYDLAFVRTNERQEIILNNSRSAQMTGGSFIPVIGSPGRGAVKVFPGDIHPLLGTLPELELLASGGVLYSDSVAVYGKAKLPAGSVVTVKNGSSAYSTNTGADSIFFRRIPLNDGQNPVRAEFQSPNGLSVSSSVLYNYEKPVTPAAKIRTVIQTGVVSLYADSSQDPAGGALQFSWSQDSLNPSQVSLSSASGSPVTFALPNVQGEYYFTLRATNQLNKTGWARAVVKVVSGEGFVPDYSAWHPEWMDTSIIYSIFVRTFDQSGTFNGVKNRLSELKDLGVDVIWFLPVHPTTTDHGPDNPGYATTDYMDVLPQYGTKQDFKALIDAAHKLGIKVILDHVIQHSSDLHPFMKDAKKYLQYSPYYPFYYWDSNGNFQYLFTWVSLPSINYSVESTRDYLLRVGKYWVHDFGVDGYRCDVAWAINDIRPEGPAFWQRWRRELKAVKPDVYLMAEADAKFPRYFDAKFDVAYDWSLFNAMRSIASGTTSIASLDTIIQSYFDPLYPQHARQYRFLENQDEQRFLEAFGLSKTKVAASFMFSVPGIPSLYAGQEVGEMTFRGNIRWNDPLSLRPFYKKLIALRRKTPALYAGDYRRINNNKPGEVYTVLRRKGPSNAVMNFNFSNSQQAVIINVPPELLSYDSTATFYLNDEINRLSYQVTGSQLRNYQLNIPGNTAQIFILSDQPLTGTEEEQQPAPQSFAVSQNYPNPFNPSTAVRYTLPEASKVNASVYNMLGEKIDELVNSELNAGIYEAVWDAGKFSSGVYFISIEARPVNGAQVFRSVKKVIMLK